MIPFLPSIRMLMAALAGFVLLACTEEELLQEEPASPELIQLGAYLFHDRNLSEPQGVSCASCHVEPLAFTGNNGSPVPSVPRGSMPRSIGTRNSPSILYSKFSPIFYFAPEERAGNLKFIPYGGQFWDGRALTLTEQAKSPFFNPVEMNNPSVSALMNKIRNSPYAQLFASTFGPDAFTNDDADFQHVARAITAYERSLESQAFSSKFDAVLTGNAQFTQQEAYGYALFKDPRKGNCIQCHAGNEQSGNPRDWLFTNFSYESLGVPRHRGLPANQNSAYFDLGLCQNTTLRSFTAGLSGVDLNQFCGYFKIPTLRNVSITGPYMHNGVFQDLKDVVWFYATRDSQPERWYGPGSMYDDLPSQHKGNITTVAPLVRNLGKPLG
jgi:cytochrome c peroxidase